MLIIDGDYPMAVGALDSGRDLTLPIDQVRTAPELASRMRWSDDGAMASLPEMRNGAIAVAVVKMVACVKRPVHDHGDYRSDELAYSAAQGQLVYYRILEARGESRILESRGGYQ